MGLVDKLVNKVVDAATSKAGAVIIGLAGIFIAAIQKGGEASCPDCGGPMIFHESELEYLEYWECTKCGRHMTDEEYRAELDDEDYDEDDPPNRVDDILDIPAGCRACGGDYPNCISGCNMFDD